MSGGTTSDAWGYTYDRAFNRLTRTHDGTTTSYGYDAANQLRWGAPGGVADHGPTAPAGATTFEYDAAGQQTRAGDRPQTFDVRHRQTTIGSTSLGYTSPTAVELAKVGEDDQRQSLLGITQIGVGATAQTFTRDPNGVLVAQRQGGESVFPLTDALGSTIALVDTSGTVVKRYAYTPDGEDTASGDGPATPFRFAGGQSVGGLTHFGHRYYDPTTARWTQPDPLLQYADLTQANRYSYVAGDPVNNLDPTGKNIFEDGWNWTKRRAKGAFKGAVDGGGNGAVVGAVGGCLAASSITEGIGCGPGAVIGSGLGTVGGIGVGGIIGGVKGED